MIASALKSFDLPSFVARPTLVRVRPQMRFAGNEEPSLRDMLDDPMTHRLMASDGIDIDTLMKTIRAAQASLRNR